MTIFLRTDFVDDQGIRIPAVVPMRIDIASLPDGFCLQAVEARGPATLDEIIALSGGLPDVNSHSCRFEKAATLK